MIYQTESRMLAGRFVGVGISYLTAFDLEDHCYADYVDKLLKELSDERALTIREAVCNAGELTLDDSQVYPPMFSIEMIEPTVSNAPTAVIDTRPINT